MYIFGTKNITMEKINHLNMSKVRRNINAETGKNWTESLDKTKFKTKIE